MGTCWAGRVELECLCPFGSSQPLSTAHVAVVVLQLTPATPRSHLPSCPGEEPLPEDPPEGMFKAVAEPNQLDNMLLVRGQGRGKVFFFLWGAEEGTLAAWEVSIGMGLDGRLFAMGGVQLLCVSQVCGDCPTDHSMHSWITECFPCPPAPCPQSNQMASYCQHINSATQQALSKLTLMEGLQKAL